MNILDYLKKEDIDTLHSSIHKQVLGLKELLGNKDNFKQKDDWKKVSFVTEGREDDRE